MDFIKAEDHLCVQTIKYLQNYVPQKSVVLEIASNASALKSKYGKVCIIGYSHSNHINKRKFRKELGKCLN